MTEKLLGYQEYTCKSNFQGDDRVFPYAGQCPILSPHGLLEGKV